MTVQQIPMATYPIKVKHINLEALKIAAPKSEDDRIVYNLMKTFASKWDWGEVSLSDLQASGVTEIELTLALLDDCGGGWLFETTPKIYRPTHEFISYVFSRWPVF